MHKALSGLMLKQDTTLMWEEPSLCPEKKSMLLFQDQEESDINLCMYAFIFEIVSHYVIKAGL